MPVATERKLLNGFPKNTIFHACITLHDALWHADNYLQ